MINYKSNKFFQQKQLNIIKSTQKFLNKELRPYIQLASIKRETLYSFDWENINNDLTAKETATYIYTITNSQLCSSYYIVYKIY